ncbi:ABC transporter permease subunit [Devosia sp.]|uniref:ABC transporter permease subunit n=1 Tax=Devosia sp. TaxID=1871048 RepID=UPI003A8D0D7D
MRRLLPRFLLVVFGALLVLFVLLELLPHLATRGGLDPQLLLAALLRMLALSPPGEDVGAIFGRLAVTLPLSLMALCVALLAGLPLAVVAAARPGGWFDRWFGAKSTILALLPPFWLGLVLALMRTEWLPALPAGGFIPWDQPLGAFASLLLPALALAIPHAAVVALSLRGEIAARSTQAEIELLRAAGLTGAAARSRLAIAALRCKGADIAATCFGTIVIGAVLVEGVFYLPGLGRLVLGAATTRDLPVLQPGLYALELLVALGMLVLRLGRLLLDPDLERRA